MLRNMIGHKVFWLSVCAVCFSACQDDEETAGQQGKRNSTVETCQPSTFKSVCLDEGTNRSASVCTLTSKGFVSGKTACSSGQTCIEYDGKAECVDQCTEEGEVLSESCEQVRDGSAALKSVVQKVVCTRFEDGQLYGIKEETECSGVCYHGKCAGLGEPCDVKVQDKETVLGCNGRDIYVCDRNRTIRKEVCQANGLCQTAETQGDAIYYCAESCQKASGSGNVCAVGVIAAIPTKCVEFSDNEIYKVNVDSSRILLDTGGMYCEDGALKTLPHSTCCAGKINCVEECYGNVALTRFNKDHIYEDCSIGLCHINKEWGYHECMQPCEKEGEEIIQCGAFGYDDESASSLLECVRFDDGLYYRTEQVNLCLNGCADNQCR